MTFRILARSNIKDSMTFLMAEPPLRRPDQQLCQGDPAHRNVPARICTASEGIKLTGFIMASLEPVHLGAELIWGFATRKWRNAGRVAAAISMVSAGVEARS